jgi:hypothetical protein
VDLVTIATFGNLPEAELAKERLENEGITAFVLHENTAGTMPFLSTSAAGVQVQVKNTDASRAREVLGS